MSHVRLHSNRGTVGSGEVSAGERGFGTVSEGELAVSRNHRGTEVKFTHVLASYSHGWPIPFSSSTRTGNISMIRFLHPKTMTTATHPRKTFHESQSVGMSYVLLTGYCPSGIKFYWQVRFLPGFAVPVSECGSAVQIVTSRLCDARPSITQPPQGITQ